MTSLKSRFSFGGVTSYRLDSDDGYEQLYRRLTGQHDTPKPPLGKLKPLEPKRREVLNP